MYIEKVLDIWVQLMKNGGKNKNVAFIILISINTKKNNYEIQVESFWECSTSVFILLFYNCFVFFRNPASTLFFIDIKQK